MEKPFKELRGMRVYLIAPKVVSELIHLTQEARKSLAKSKMGELTRLKVYAVGNAVTDIHEGDEVLVGDVALMNAPIIDLDPEIGLSVILINSLDIIMVW